MKKRWTILAALMMMACCVGCGDTKDNETEAVTTETATTEAATTEAATTEAVTTEETMTEAATEDLAAFPEVTVENPITYFQMTLAENAENMCYVSATLLGSGEVTVEYVGEEKKVGSFDESLLHGITAVVEELKLSDLNGQDVYGEGDAFGSMYVNYEDGSYLSASFSGTIAEEYIAAYEEMDARFQNLTAELPVYVPQPFIDGEVDANVLTEMQEILNQSGMEPLDSLAISNVPMDEYFGMTVGLSATEGIVNGTNCYPMMSSIAYSLIVVTVEDAENIAAVRKDFEESMDWNKWVCVSASNALIAEKGNMVLCLMGSDSSYEQTAQAIEATGWTELQYLENSGM